MRPEPHRGHIADHLLVALELSSGGNRLLDFLILMAIEEVGRTAPLDEQPIDPSISRLARALREMADQPAAVLPAAKGARQ